MNLILKCFNPILIAALIVFSDGRYIGAILDRNGLRPARYYTTTDGMIYMSSEVGVVDLPDVVGVKAKGRLKPGRLLIVDTEAGELLNDEQLKEDIAGRYPIDKWIQEGVSFLGASNANNFRMVIIFFILLFN